MPRQQHIGQNGEAREKLYILIGPAYAKCGEVMGGEAGYLFSVPPSVIRSEQKQKLVRRLPLESLCLESDSPVLGPEREQRNEPANLTYARDFIAETHGVSPERVEEVTSRNAVGLFPKLASLAPSAAS